jgi:urocanate hydratase
LKLALDNDTSLGVMRYADAGYNDALDEAAKKNIRYFGSARAASTHGKGPSCVIASAARLPRADSGRVRS